MTEKEFIERLRSNPRPVVVDFWAPWCAPCRAIGPVVDKLGEEYVGHVDLWKVNADEQPDLLRLLQIYGIPTLIAFRNDQEVTRWTGAASSAILSSLFESALSGEKPKRTGPTPFDRLLRLGVGMALIGVAFVNGVLEWNLLLAGLGGIVLFTAVYDRCPIYRAVSTRVKEILRRNPPNPSNS